MVRVQLLVVMLLTLVTTLQCQNDPDRIGSREKRQVLDSVLYHLNTSYVFPQVARKMEEAVNARWDYGAYEGVSDPEVFARALTEDLYEISGDRHLRVRFDPAGIRAMREANTEEAIRQRESKRLEEMKAQHFGFREVTVLEGNIGYIDLRNFHEIRYAEEVATEAMRQVAGTDAMIIDLRKNGGGSPGMIRFLASYFFSEEPVHLNNFYWRASDSIEESWTFRNIPGERRPDVPLYILTSSYTFSAAEEFSYDLKNLKRATLVGETTGGGAHPGDLQIATERFAVWVPAGRAISPVTGTNWEGTGVSPHINVPAEQALEKACELALTALLNAAQEEDVREKYRNLLRKTGSENIPDREK